MTEAAQSARAETRPAQSAREDKPAESARRRRIAGGSFVATGIVSAALAVGFHVGFLTDPIGPRALPWLGSALLALGGLLMLLRSGATHSSMQKPPQPDSLEDRRNHRITPEQRKVALALLTFLLYAAILSAAGFVLSTALLMTLLARFYGGTWKRGIVAGVAFSASLWLLFVQALGVPLPVGSIFLIGG